MDFDKLSKNRIIHFFSLTVIFVLLANFLSGYFLSELKPEKVTRKIETIIHKKEIILEKVFETLSEKAPDNIQKTLTDAKFEKTLLNNNNFTFFIYYRDTLIHWSNNGIPVPIIYDSAVFSHNVGFFENSWCLVKSQKIREYTVIGMIHLKNMYPYQNEFLRNHINQSLSKISICDISPDKNENAIHSKDGNYLFSLIFHKNAKISDGRLFILFFTYLAAFIFFVLLLYYGHKKLNPFKSELFFVAAFSLDLILVRGILFYFKIPNSLYNSELFGPSIYASSELLPSLGDLFVNILVLISIVFVVYKHFPLGTTTREKSDIRRYFVLFTLLFHVVIFFRIMLGIIDGLILHSDISFDLTDIFNLSIYSIFGYTSIAILSLSFFLVSVRLIQKSMVITKKKWEFYFFLFVILIISIYVFRIEGENRWFYIGFTGVFLLSLWFLNEQFKNKFTFISIIYFLMLFSVLVTFILHINNDFKEKEERKLVALSMSNEQDPITEELFGELEKNIYKDSYIESLFQKEKLDDNTIISYILGTYFSKHWQKYKFQATICSPVDSLLIKPNNIKTGCIDYFNTLLKLNGKLTNIKNLYFIDDNTWESNYIGVFQFFRKLNGVEIPMNIFLEINSKYIPKDLGYPELLIDKSVKNNSRLNQYSYARFENGQLIDKFGKYFYSMDENDYSQSDTNSLFFSKNGYNHYYSKIDNYKTLLVSRKQKSTIDIIAPFSYLFVFFGLFVLILQIFQRLPFNFKKTTRNFKDRLQISITLIILVSFFVIGTATIYYIIRLNNNKNQDILSEKTHSVLIEIEQKLANVSKFSHENTAYLNDILLPKFSGVFFTDINLFDLQGNLLGSSRQELFNEYLISTKMNPIAFRQMNAMQKSLFIHRENIGGLKYLSAYIPFRNTQNQIIAYLNLPYFAKENQLITEISTFLIAYINIYVILIVFAVISTVLISNYIARPMKLIKDKMRKINIGIANEKIEWTSKDEIGELIGEYNRMIDELTQSAELLAQSERESAWREMAKQVAHEIKNPLTPMKLSVQYLQKAWAENSPDWEKRLERFTKTIVEQIESLSLIASEFSNFAAMPKPKEEKLELMSQIYNSVELFSDLENIKVQVNPEKHGPYFVVADKEQMIRVFNNLLKNSCQAIGDKKNGQINIDIIEEEGNFVISIEDNGSGISHEMTDRIFSPNFTTKSSGMGLGLAMVKNIIQNAKGRIWFKSDGNNGTIFYISLPKLNI